MRFEKTVFILMTLFYVFFVFHSNAQETVGVINMKSPAFVSYNGNVKTAIKIFRNIGISTPLDVTYTVSGSSNTTLSSGTTTIPPYSQVSIIEISATSAPLSNETLTVTVTDISNPDYDLEGRNTVDIIVTAQEPTPAFLGAEGAAKYIGSELASNTWRGGGCYFVTNCNTGGAGSFSQAALDADSNGGGYVVFRVDCDVSLTTRMTMAYSGVYIAGQTAPGDGILINGYNSPNGVATFNNSDNMLVRYINWVHGARLTGGAIDAVGFYNANNAYFNHNSVFRGDDELISAATTDVNDWTGSITFDWNLFGEAYWDPVSTTGTLNHNTATIMGGLQGNGGRNQIFTGNFSWNKNLTYNVSHRFPNFSGSIHGESVNNLIANHNYRLIQASYPQPKFNWTNNYVQAGNETNNIDEQPFSEGQYFAGGNKMSRGSITFDDEQMALIYASGNVLEDTDGDILIPSTGDSWLFNTYYFDLAFIDNPYPRSNELLAPVDIYGATDIMTAEQARSALLGNGGAGASARLNGDGTVTYRQNSWYQGRIDNVSNRTIPNHPDVDTWAADQPTWSSGSTPYADTDNDGMGDVWEIANGLNVGVDDHAGHDFHPVYDNIEIFLSAGLDTEIPSATPGKVIKRIKSSGGGRLKIKNN